jgi:hypothetical protein
MYVYMYICITYRIYWNFMCLNYSVAVFRKYFATAPFICNRLVLSAFMNRKETSFDTLVNREFCCHHKRSQKKLSEIPLTNGKKISWSRSRREKLHWHQSCIGIHFCRNKIQEEKLFLWPYLWVWISSMAASMSRKFTMQAFRERNLTCVQILFLPILQLQGLGPMAFSNSWISSERMNLIDTW